MRNAPTDIAGGEAPYARIPLESRNMTHSISGRRCTRTAPGLAV